jgi:hypothetical protein
VPNPKRKGGANERRIATKLSLWFSGGERDDIFWRTDSGSRGTTRGRKGKKTANAQGDIVALDAVGIPLLDVWCIECKKGYSDKLDLLAMIDSRARHHEIITFWEQTLESAQAATAAPLVIIQRDRRKDVAVISQYMFDEMYDWLTATPPASFNFIRVKYGTYDLIVMELENFLTLWPPSVYNTIYQEKQRLQENESKNQETGISAGTDTERRPGRHAQGKSNRPSTKTSKRRVAEAD